MTDAARASEVLAAPAEERALPAASTLPRRVALVAVLLLCLQVLAIVLDARAMGMTADESSYFNSGRIILRHGWVHLATRFQGPLGFFANQLFVEPFGGEFPPGGLSDFDAQRELILRGRLGTLPFALLASVLVLVWARRLFGDGGALLALLVVAFHPVLLGYSSLMLVDAQHAAMTLLVLYVLWRWLEARSPRLLIGLGAALGLALATKYLAVLLALVVGATVSVAAAWRARGLVARAAGALRAFLVVALCAFATLHAAYLFRGGFAGRDAAAFQSPVVRGVVEVPVLGHAAALLPAPFLQGVDYQLVQSEAEWKPFLNGAFAPRQPLTYAFALLYKTPEVTLVCVLLALALRGRCLFAAQGERAWRTAALAVLPFAGVYFVYLSASRMQLGIRYVLPLVPLLGLAAGALVWSPERRVPGPRFFVLLALLGAIHACELASSWPDWISYYNRAAGGQLRAFHHFRDTSNDFGQYRFDGPARLQARHAELQLLGPRSGARFGKLAVDHDSLMFDPQAPEGVPFTWLTWLEPLDHLGASWWVFELTPEAFEQEVARRDDATLRRDLALAYLGAGRRAEAEPHLAALEAELVAPLRRAMAAEDTVRARPERAELEALIEAWRDLGRADLDAALAEQHAATLGDSDAAALARGEALEERRDYAGMARVLDRAWNDPRFPGRLLRMRALREAGDFPEAGALLAEIERDRGGKLPKPVQKMKADVQLRLDFLRLLR